MVLGGNLEKLCKERDNGESETYLIVILRKIMLCRYSGYECFESEIVLLK